MTTRNNFDTSSTGINIEFSGQYDADKSQYELDNNFEILQRSNTLAYYIDNGNLPSADTVTFTVQGARDAKIKYLSEQSATFDSEEIQKWDDETLDKEIFSYTDSGVYVHTYESCNTHDLKDTGLEILPSKTLITIETRGYSQGDYAKVIYCPDDILKAWGKMPEENEIQKIVNNLFWDQPVYAVMTINDVEYNYHDAPNYNEYEWNREEFAAYVAEKSGVPLDTILNLIPEDLY